MDAALEARHERRVHPRVPAGRRACRIRPGHDAVVINVSRRGALLETDRRLLPGAALDLQWAVGGLRHAARASVLRSSVSGVAPSRISYRAAVRFDHDVSDLWEDAEPSRAHAGSCYPGPGGSG